MNDIFELNIFDDIKINTDEYSDFVICTESLDLLLFNNIFMEAATGQSHGIIKGVKGAINRASKGTQDALNVYNDATDAGGAMVNAIYQLTVNTLGLITKIIKFILVNLSKIPLTLANMIKYLTKLPEKVRNKIHGNIELYITIDDISLLQNDIIKYLSEFMTLATSFTSEDTDYTTGIFIFSGTDFKTYDRMNEIYKKISKVKFEKSTITMNNKQAVETYLSPISEYYTGLNNILKSLNTDKPKFEKLIDMAENKFNANQIKGVVAKLSPTNQLKAKNSIQMISKIVSIMGNLVKYIIADITTVDKTIKHLQKSDKNNLLKTNDK